MIPDKTIGRLSLYRRLLTSLESEGTRNVYSHELAAAASVSAAQVRRDLMSIGYTGSTAKGYHITELIRCVGTTIDCPEGQKVALVGVGHLGKAIVNYFAGRRPKLAIVAAFDVDEHKTGRVIHGVRSYAMTQLEEIVAREGITMAILTVPADSARAVAQRLERSGIKGILNLAPIPLDLGPGVYVEDMDITMSLEKVAYYACHQTTTKGGN